MKDLLSLLQSLAWPAFALIMVLFFRSQLHTLVSVLIERIRSGDDVEIGKEGIKLKKRMPSDVIDDSNIAKDTSYEVEPEGMGEEMRFASAPSKGLCLTHTAKRAPTLDKPNYRYFRLRFWINSEVPTEMEEVASVTYLLHETFKNPVRKVTDRDSSFALNTIAWGEFTLRASVTLKDGSKRNLERYINLPVT